MSICENKTHTGIPETIMLNIYIHVYLSFRDPDEMVGDRALCLYNSLKKALLPKLYWLDTAMCTIPIYLAANSLKMCAIELLPIYFTNAINKYLFSRKFIPFF